MSNEDFKDFEDYAKDVDDDFLDDFDETIDECEFCNGTGFVLSDDDEEVECPYCGEDG